MEEQAQNNQEALKPVQPTEELEKAPTPEEKTPAAFTPETPQLTTLDKTKQPRSKSKLLIIILVILLIASIAAIVCLIVINIQNTKPQNQNQNSQSAQTSDDNQSTSQQSSNESEETNTDISKETEITDTLLLEDLNTKLVYLNDAERQGKTIDVADNFTINGILNPVFSTLYQNTNLTEEQRLQLLFAALEYENKFNLVRYKFDPETLRDYFSTIPYSNANIAETLDSWSAGAWNSIEYIDAKYVSERYQNLFGLAFPNSQIIPGICDIYIYDQNNNYYYNPKIGGCGGVSFWNKEIYKEKFTQADNKAYIYVSVAPIYRGESGCFVFKDESQITYQPDNYTPVLDANLYYNCTNDSNSQDKQYINSSNYTNFAQYRFVFAKNSDGTYYFEKVERL